MASKMLTGSQAVLRMRDDFVRLVSAYNETGCYPQAQEAQELVIALNRFEDRHVLTEMQWPPATHMVDGAPEFLEVE